MRVLTISDSPTCFSGLARVHRHVIDSMVESGHDVLACSWFAYDSNTLAKIKDGGAPPVVSYSSNGKEVPLRAVEKSKASGGKQHRGMFAVYNEVESFRPDIVVTIGDHWDFYYMQALKSAMAFSFKWVACLTIERDEIEREWLPMLRYADAVVVPSEFGRKVLSGVGIESFVAPYGAEPVFRRAADVRRSELRKQRGCADKIRFITVAQNTGRKNLPALIQAVEQLAHRDPNHVMQFYLHSNFGRCDPQEAFLYDLKSIIDKLNVRDWFVFPEDERAGSIFKAPDDSSLVDEYNAADVFVLPSNFEGYGLPVVEAMACGLPVIANGTSTMPEHLGAKAEQSYGFATRGFLVSNRVEILPPDRIVRRVRPDALAQAIWEMRLLIGDANRTPALSKMRESCEEYGRSRTWEGMKLKLSEVVAQVSSNPITLPTDVV
jgi:glycosyltransferase involved in cell wall biosynthesis